MSNQLTLILLDANVAHAVVQLEAQREDVVIVGAVAHNKGSIRLAGEDLLSRLAGQRTPVPAVL